MLSCRGEGHYFTLLYFTLFTLMYLTLLYLLQFTSPIPNSRMFVELVDLLTYLLTYLLHGAISFLRS